MNGATGIWITIDQAGRGTRLRAGIAVWRCGTNLSSTGIVKANKSVQSAADQPAAERNFEVRSIRLVASVALAAMLPLSFSASVATAEDSEALSLFQDSSDSFLHYRVAPHTAEPAWMKDEVGDNAAKDADADAKADVGREPTAEERLRKLEESMQKLDAKWTKFDSGEKIKKTEAATKPTFKIGGRIQADYWDFMNQSAGIGYFEHPIAVSPNYGQDPEDTFAFRRVRLECQGDIPDNMLWRLQVDFNNPNSPEMKDVYFGFRQLPGNQTLLFGNQKIPLGLDSLNSSRFNVFVERPLVIDAFSTDYRRPGICMYGNTDDESINWRYGAFYLENISNDGRYVGDARQMSIIGRLAGSPWYDDSRENRGYLHWGIAGMVAKPDGGAGLVDGFSNEARFGTRPEGRSQGRWYDTGPIPGADWFETIGLESILNLGPMQIVGEYESTFVQRSQFGDTHYQGAYAYVSWFLTGEHIPYERTSGTLERVQPNENFFLVDRSGRGRATGWGAWNVAARYSYLDLSDKDISGGVGHAGTLALNWHWNAYAKLQFDLTYGQISDRKPISGFTDGNYTLCGTRFAVDF